MKLDYTKIIPRRYHDVSYENDVTDVVKGVVKEQIQKRDGLYIRGDVGVGKTHLACALVKKFIEEGLDVRFYNTSDFLERLRDEFKNGVITDESSEGLFRDTMNYKGILVLDDIGTEKVTDWVNERLYLIINKRYEDMLPTIFTSNCDMETFSARLGDRFSSRVKQMTRIINLVHSDRRLTPKL
jgi:DNA replication protein DnaC